LTEPYTLAQLADYADPEFDQHFLVDSDKLNRIVAAAEITPTDRVLEIGAGLGTVARELPPCARLTLIELDSRLIEPLRAAVPPRRSSARRRTRTSSRDPIRCPDKQPAPQGHGSSPQHAAWPPLPYGANNNGRKYRPDSAGERGICAQDSDPNRRGGFQSSPRFVC
jgi:hypothetical protein